MLLLRCWISVVVVVSVGPVKCQAFEGTHQSTFNTERREHIEELRSQAILDLGRGYFGQAAEKLAEIVKLQTLEFGPAYYRTTTAKQLIESLERIAEFPAADREKARTAFLAQSRGSDAVDRCDFISAARDFNLAVDLLSSLLAPDDFSLLNAQDRYAAVLRLTGQYDAATALFTKVAVMRLQTLGKEHPFYADALAGIGLTFVEQKQYDKATQLLAATKRCWKANDSRSPEYLLSTINLGNCYLKREMYAEAIDQFVEARELAAALKIPRHYNLSYGPLNGLAYAYVKTGRTDEAEALAKEAVQGVEADWPGDSPPVATLYATYALVLRSVGKPIESAAAAQRSRDIRSRLLGYHGSAGDL